MSGVPDGFDPQALERLRDLGGTAFLRQMIGLFLDLAQQKLQAAQAAERAGDIPAIGKAIHALRSSSGNIGASTMQELATRIDELAREQNPGHIPALLRQLEAAFARVRPRLEQERDSLST
jgi:HPt (histidine-containing phosphotransfer) domain-containing protein